MMRTLAILVLSLCTVGGAHALDLEKDLKKALEQAQQIKPEQAAQDSGAGAVQALLKGYWAEDEAAIGRQIAGNLLGAAPLVQDPKLQAYVNNVGRWVAGQSERAGLEWHFGVIESGDVNAFAIPGGYVFVTRGLYARLQNEAELAGVLAHEVAHVTRKHHLKLLQQGRLLDLGARTLGKRMGEDERIGRLIGSGAEIVARSLDKNAEFEADRMGVVLAARAGYDAFGLPVVLQEIGHLARDDSAVSLLFKTHPHPDDRLAQLDAAVDGRLDGLKGLTLAKRFYRIKN